LDIKFRKLLSMNGALKEMLIGCTSQETWAVGDLCLCLMLLSMRNGQLSQLICINYSLQYYINTKGILGISTMNTVDEFVTEAHQC